jgi:four helix bundle protein
MTEYFPESEKFCITSQIRRTFLSVSSNIAEGSSRKSKKDQAHFYSIAYSSLMEGLNQLIISNDLGYFDDYTLKELRNDVHTVSLMINRLIKYSVK